MTRLKKIIGLSSAFIVVLCLFSHSIMVNSFVDYPREPIPSGAEIIPYVAKGITVYISPLQHQMMNLLVWIGWGFAALVVLILVIHKGDSFKK